MKNYNFGPIDFNKSFPAKIEIIDVGSQPHLSTLHWHKDVELVYILKGQLIIEKNGNRRFLNEDNIFLFNARDIHKISASDYWLGGKYMSIHLSSQYIARQFPALDEISIEISNGIEVQNKLKNTLHRIIRFMQFESDELIDLAIHSEVLSLLYVLLSKCLVHGSAEKNPAQKTTHYKAKTVLDYVDRNFQKRISRTEMATMVGLSPVYFSIYFKNATGMNFLTYLNSVRLEHALIDMFSFGSSVNEAAQNNGFSNERALCSACKRVYGMTPTKLKETNRSMVKGDHLNFKKMEVIK